MKKLITLAIGYIAGTVVTGLYTDKKWSEVRKQMADAKKQGKDEIQSFFGFFSNIHQKFFGEVKDTVMSEENQKMVKEKFEEVSKLIEVYRDEAEDMLKNIKKSWTWYAKKVYEEMDTFSKLKVDDAEKRLVELWEKWVLEFRKKFDTLVKNLKKQYTQTKKTPVKKTTKQTSVKETVETKKKPTKKAPAKKVSATKTTVKKSQIKKVEPKKSVTKTKRVSKK